MQIVRCVIRLYIRFKRAIEAARNAGDLYIFKLNSADSQTDAGLCVLIHNPVSAAVDGYVARSAL